MKILAQIESDSSDKIYEIRVGNDLRAYCTCMAWKISKCEPKSCKHLERYMLTGADYMGSKSTNQGKNAQEFTIRSILLD